MARAKKKRGRYWALIELADGDEKALCSRCIVQLALADAQKEGNLVERRFWGRIPIEAGAALLKFKRGNLSQRVVHSIKYHNNQPLVRLMGRQLGELLRDSHRFDSVDLLLPVPLHRKKERRRGYNQSLLLCQGIADVFPRPISIGAVVRQKATDTQTNKTREERLDNMRDVFLLKDGKALENKHILIVDDVITTGATTEACYQAMRSVEGLRVSVAYLAVAGDC